MDVTCWPRLALFFIYYCFLFKEGADPDSVSGTEFQTGPPRISPAQAGLTTSTSGTTMCPWRQADAAAAGASVLISLNIHHLQVRTAGCKPIRLEPFYLQNKSKLLVWVFGESRKRTMMNTMAINGEKLKENRWCKWRVKQLQLSINYSNPNT